MQNTNIQITVNDTNANPSMLLSTADVSLTFPDGSVDFVTVPRESIADPKSLEIAALTVSLLLNEGDSVYQQYTFDGNLYPNGKTVSSRVDQCKWLTEALSQLTETNRLVGLDRGLYTYNGTLLISSKGWLLNNARQSGLESHYPLERKITKYLEKTDLDSGKVTLMVANQLSTCVAIVSEDYTGFSPDVTIAGLLYRLLITGIVSPKQIETYYAEERVSEMALISSIRNRDIPYLLSLGGKTYAYSTSNISVVYEDFLNGILPDSSELGYDVPSPKLLRNHVTGIFRNESGALEYIRNGVFVADTWNGCTLHEYYGFLLKLAAEPDMMSYIDSDDFVYLDLNSFNLKDVPAGHYELKHNGVSATLVKGEGNTQPYIENIAVQGEVVAPGPVIDARDFVNIIRVRFVKY